ncbi:hypothetical protein GP486_001554, partial [Trichoglossum hirsutum]
VQTALKRSTTATSSRRCFARLAPRSITSSSCTGLRTSCLREHLGVDAQYGGLDQRRVFALAAETLPEIGYKQRAHLVTLMAPGLKKGGKMLSPEPNSKIDSIDPSEVVAKKLKKAEAAPRELERNGLVAFLTRQLLKGAITTALTELLSPIRVEFQASSEWQEIEGKACPLPETKKKIKKFKEIGTGYPGVKASSRGKARQRRRRCGQAESGFKHWRGWSNGEAGH